MFQFNLELPLHLLTIVRTGVWSLDTVHAYEIALRRELKLLHAGGGPTCCILDVRAIGAQSPQVSQALHMVVQRLGPLNVDRSAVVTATGISKLEAKRMADENAEVFTAMVLARDWAIAAG